MLIEVGNKITYAQSHSREMHRSLKYAWEDSPDQIMLSNTHSSLRGDLRNEETTNKDKASGNPLRTLDEIKFGYTMDVAATVHRHAMSHEEMDWF